MNLYLKTVIPFAALCGIAICHGNEQPAKTSHENQVVSRLGVNWQPSEHDRANAALAWERLSAYHRNKPASNRKLHVAYVTFQDRPALANYKDRYDRILKHIQAYYADQMQANGFPPLSFKLDLDEQGKLVVHDVHVDTPMSALNVNSSGPVSLQAVKHALAAKGIDADKEHVLIVCQLPDGIGPYYGMGHSHAGIAWICDQEGLDPANLTLTDPMPNARYPMSKGKNATTYIGGTAHELGHAFGLPHTGNATGYPDAGHSLMGSGNHTYGEELRYTGKGTYLAPTDALKLASVPLFNGVETPMPPHVAQGRFLGRYVPGAPVQSFDAKVTENGLSLSYKLKPGHQAYGVIVHLDPLGNNDYDSNAEGAALDRENTATLTIQRPEYRGKTLETRITVLNCDGTQTMYTVPLQPDKPERFLPDLTAALLFEHVQHYWQQGRFAEAKKALEQLPAEYPDRLSPQDPDLAMWRQALDHPQGTTPDVDPAQASADLVELPLTRAKPVRAAVGWARLGVNSMPPSDLGPAPVFTETGRQTDFLFAHAPARLQYDLNGQWQHFSARVGLPAGSQGSVQFRILADGKQVAVSPVLRGGESVLLQGPVNGVHDFVIEAGDGGDHNGSDWGIIAEGKLTRDKGGE